jgi:hypothetical protein
VQDASAITQANTAPARYREGVVKPDKPEHEEERISLAGHDPEDVLRALLKVDPEAEPVEDNPAPPHGDALKNRTSKE